MARVRIGPRSPDGRVLLMAEFSYRTSSPNGRVLLMAEFVLGRVLQYSFRLTVSVKFSHQTLILL